MRSIDENIQALTRTVLNEAHAEAEQMLAEAQANAQAVRERAQAQASAARDEMLTRATQEAERLRSQAIASAQLQELERREKLLDSVFDAARQRIADVQQRDDYDQIARDLLRQALLTLGADTVQIRADERTQTALTDQVIAEISTELGVQVTPGTPLEHGVGVIVQTADGHRQYDNTLEARLERLQNTLRAPVLRLLKGEDS
jgi:vacuolar-type H+-ATPase subunit E/Vma4